MERRSRKSASSLGFTLVELMVVVVLVGVLATIGIVLFRRWIFHTRAVEASGMIQSIRVAQERCRSENGAYFDVSKDMTSNYPMAVPGRTLYAWKQDTHTDYLKWKQLNPTVSGPVQFGYVTKAGAPFTDLALPTWKTGVTFPAKEKVTEPWYVIQAVGDTDENGVSSYYVGLSLTGEVYKENEGE